MLSNLLLRNARGNPQQVPIRSFQELTKQALKKVIRTENVEQNAKLWLAGNAVNEPTTSILDPAPGYDFTDPKYIYDLSLDYSRRHGKDPLAKLDLTNAADPFQFVKYDIDSVTDNVKKILGTDHPVLSAVSKYFFENDGGKKVRPVMVLLLSAAAKEHRLKDKLDSEKILETDRYIVSPEFAEASQKRLAEITEMIHTASLLHDDVIDESETRRDAATVNKVFGDKLAILGGDFMLARSSICLARLRNFEAIELMSTAIEHLIKGEVMQMRGNSDESITALEYYLRKNFYKTGSLMANSCKAALVLNHHSDHLCNMAFAYGRHIGLAFQLIDDVLDYEGNHSGKPMLADLKAGLVTAPVLLAQEEFPQLKELASRKFSQEGDIELANELVKKSNGLQRTKELAIEQAELACDAILQFEPSDARDALAKLAQIVVHRQK